jgi:hypothetical protein
LPIPLEHAVAGFGISIVAVLIITFVYRAYVRGRSAKFWDIIREKDWHPSLARFQFLIWTWVCSLLFLEYSLSRFLVAFFKFKYYTTESLNIDGNQHFPSDNKLCDK